MGQFPTNLTAKENCDLIFNHLSNIITFLLTVSLLISLIQPLGFVQNKKMGDIFYILLIQKQKVTSVAHNNS